MIAASFFADWPRWVLELLPALWVSVRTALLILAVGLPAGLLLAVAVTYGSLVVRIVALVVVEVGRGMPGLVTIYLVYFGLPSQGLTLSALATAIVALGITTAAYTSEIFRGGLNAVGRGQYEGASAVGLTRWKTLRYVILPQAVRIVIPPTLGFAIQLFQATALLFVIGLPELLSRAYDIGNVTFRYLSVLVLAGLLYAVVAIPGAVAVRRLEHRTS